MATDIPTAVHEDDDGAPQVFDFCSDKQKAAVEAFPGPPLLLIGGFNSGKTTAAILHMLALCQAFPGYKVAVLRKTFKDLSLTTRPSFDQWIRKDFVERANEKEVVLKNGSSFIFHHLDSPQSATILKGLEINAAILDQAEQMNERTFTILMGRLGRWKGAKVPSHTLASHQGEWQWKNQSGHPVPPVSCILTANPSEEGDPELHWLWQRFASDSPMWERKWQKLGYRQMVLPSTENKFAGEQNLNLLLQQEEDYVKRFVYGEWVKSKGHLFRLTEDSILDYDPDLIHHIRSSMHLGRVLDHGDTAPTCCLWWAVDDDHNLFFWQEYYQVGVTDERDYIVSDHRRAISALSAGLSFRTNIADPSIFNRTRGITGYNSREKRWCLSPETPILTADLRHVRVDSLAIGDVIAGFDEGNQSEDFRSREYRASNRYWREAVVEDVQEVYLPSYRITLDDGSEVVCSEGHQWLVNPTGQWRLWRSTKRLKVGQKMLRATDVWEVRPERLLPKLNIGGLGRIHASHRPEIVKIEYLGIRRLIGLQTSTKTLIANGLMSHNSVADEYKDMRIITEDTAIYWKPADNNEDLSRQRLRQYLRRDDSHRHPFTGELGAPHIYFIRQSEEWPHGCHFAIREIRAAKLEVKAENDGKPIFGKDRDPHIPDHSLDCVRYCVNMRPLPTGGQLPAIEPVKAYAKPDGRVTITVPPVTEAQAAPRSRGSWKSRFGGY